MTKSLLSTIRRLSILLAAILVLIVPARAWNMKVRVGKPGESSVASYACSSANQQYTSPVITLDRGDYLYFECNDDRQNRYWQAPAGRPNQLNLYTPTNAIPSIPSTTSAMGDKLYWDGADGTPVVLTFTRYDRDGVAGSIFNISYQAMGIDSQAGYPRYYLLAPLSNNSTPSPEYELLPVADGTYTLASPMAWRADNYGVLQQNNPSYSFLISSLTVTNPAISTGATSQPGWGAMPVFSPEQKTLTFTPRTAGVDIEYDIFPYIGILGADFHQEQNHATMASDRGTTAGQTAFGWQDAFVQYAAGMPVPNPALARNIAGTSVQGAYYNTLWPPRENILFKATPAGSEPLDVNSTATTFTGVRDAAGRLDVRTGAQWLALMRGTDPNAYNADYDGLVLDPAQTYARFTARDMWLTGEFKIWTGWGSKYTDHAVWDNHLYFGPGGDATSPGNYNQPTRPMTVRTTHNAYTSAPGNYKIDTPTFMKEVHLFVPMATDQKSYLPSVPSRLYAIEALGDARIRAQKGYLDDPAEPVYGFYLPSVDFTKASAYYISDTRVVRADGASYSPESTEWQPVNADGTHVSEAEATVFHSADKLTRQADFDALWTPMMQSSQYPDYCLDTRLREGNSYFYYLKLTFTNTYTGARRTVAVPSPIFRVFATRPRTRLDVAQLVKLNADSADDAYVTYQNGANTVYDVRLDPTTGDLLSVSPRTEPLPDWTDLYFTSRQLFTTSLPSLMVTAVGTDKKVDSFRLVASTASTETTLADVADRAQQMIDKGDYSSPLYILGDNPTLQDDMLTARFRMEFTGSYLPMGEASPSPMVTAPGDAASLTHTLTFPYYTLGETRVDITAEQPSIPVADDRNVMHDFHDGTLRPSKVPQNVLLHDMSVTLDICEPKVYPAATLAALVAKAGPSVLTSTTSAVPLSLTFDPDYTGEKSITLAHIDPSLCLSLTADETANTLHQSLTPVMPAHIAPLTPVQHSECTVMTHGAERSFRPNVYRVWNAPDGGNLLHESLVMARHDHGDCIISFPSSTRDMIGDYVLNPDAGASSPQEVWSNNYFLTYEVHGDDTTRFPLAQKEELLSHYDMVKSPIILESAEPVAWWDGIHDAFTTGTTRPGMKVPLTFTLTPVYYFRGNPSLTGHGVTLAAAPRRSPDATENYVLKGAPVTTRLNNILTSVPDLPSEHQQAYRAGADYIELFHPEARIIALSGTILASSPGRHTLPAGIYLVQTPGNTARIHLR